MSTSNFQLYESFSCRRAWSLVSTTTRSVMKSGPSESDRDLIWFCSLGLPPESDRMVNCSSGESITRPGPHTTRDVFCR